MRELYLVACCILFSTSISAAMFEAPVSTVFSIGLCAALCWLLGVMSDGT